MHCTSSTSINSGGWGIHFIIFLECNIRYNHLPKWGDPTVRCDIRAQLTNSKMEGSPFITVQLWSMSNVSAVSLTQLATVCYPLTACSTSVFENATTTFGSGSPEVLNLIAKWNYENTYMRTQHRFVVMLLVLYLHLVFCLWVFPFPLCFPVFVGVFFYLFVICICHWVWALHVHHTFSMYQFQECRFLLKSTWTLACLSWGTYVAKKVVYLS